MKEIEIEEGKEVTLDGYVLGISHADNRITSNDPFIDRMYDLVVKVIPNDELAYFVETICEMLGYGYKVISNYYGNEYYYTNNVDFKYDLDIYQTFKKLLGLMGDYDFEVTAQKVGGRKKRNFFYLDYEGYGVEALGDDGMIYRVSGTPPTDQTTPIFKQLDEETYLILKT
jgi:hypothetical protein